MFTVLFIAGWNFNFFNKTKLTRVEVFSLWCWRKKNAYNLYAKTEKKKNNFLFFEFQISHIKYYCFFAGYNLTHRFLNLLIFTYYFQDFSRWWYLFYINSSANDNIVNHTAKIKFLLYNCMKKLFFLTP